MHNDAVVRAEQGAQHDDVTNWGVLTMAPASATPFATVPAGRTCRTTSPTGQGEKR
jgi:hypothetical protein